MNDWVDVGNAERGVEVATCGISSYSAAAGALGLSLLRSPVFAHLSTPKDAVAPSKHHRFMEQGEHEFGWKVIPRNGKLRPSAIERTARALNNPPIVIDEANRQEGRNDDAQLLSGRTV